MRIVLGFAITAAFSTVLTFAMIRVVRPQVDAAVAGLTYINENWPQP